MLDVGMAAFVHQQAKMEETDTRQVDARSQAGTAVTSKSANSKISGMSKISGCEMRARVDSTVSRAHSSDPLL